MRTLPRWLGWLRAHTPLVPRSWMEFEKRRADVAVRDAVNRADTIRSLHEQIAELREEALPMLQKAVALQIQRNPRAFRRFELRMSFDEMLVHEAFIHGNSKVAIHFIAERIGHMVERELTTINFSRYNDERRAQ